MGLDLHLVVFFNFTWMKRPLLADLGIDFTIGEMLHHVLRVYKLNVTFIVYKGCRPDRSDHRIGFLQLHLGESYASGRSWHKNLTRGEELDLSLCQGVKATRVPAPRSPGAHQVVPAG